MNSQVCVQIDRPLDFTGVDTQTIDVTEYGITADVMRAWYENRYPLSINGCVLTIIETLRSNNDLGECNSVIIIAPVVSEITKGLTGMTGGVITFVAMGDDIVVASVNTLY